MLVLVGMYYGLLSSGLHAWPSGYDAIDNRTNPNTQWVSESFYWQVLLLKQLRLWNINSSRIPALTPAFLCLPTNTSPCLPIPSWWSYLWFFESTILLLYFGIYALDAIKEAVVLRVSHRAHQNSSSDPYFAYPAPLEIHPWSWHCSLSFSRLLKSAWPWSFTWDGLLQFKSSSSRLWCAVAFKISYRACSDICSLISLFFFAQHGGICRRISLARGTWPLRCWYPRGR